MLTRMSEPAEKTRRAWFQIHLSTALVMMFVAGGLLHQNLTPILRPDKGVGRTYRNGWPFEARYVSRNEIIDSALPQIVTLDNEEATISVGRLIDFEPAWNHRALAADVLIAMGVLATSSLLVEWLLRRREARAP